MYQVCKELGRCYTLAYYNLPVTLSDGMCFDLSALYSHQVRVTQSRVTGR